MPRAMGHGPTTRCSGRSSNGRGLRHVDRGTIHGDIAVPACTRAELAPELALPALGQALHQTPISLYWTPGGVKSFGNDRIELSRG
jgi:hypothetical protein